MLRHLPGGLHAPLPGGDQCCDELRLRETGEIHPPLLHCHLWHLHQCHPNSLPVPVGETAQLPCDIHLCRGMGCCRGCLAHHVCKYVLAEVVGGLHMHEIVCVTSEAVNKQGRGIRFFIFYHGLATLIHSDHFLLLAV